MREVLSSFAAALYASVTPFEEAIAALTKRSPLIDEQVVREHLDVMVVENAIRTGPNMSSKPASAT